MPRKKDVRTKRDIGNLVLTNTHVSKKNRQATFTANGFLSILEESDCDYHPVLPSEINKYKTNVLSLISIQDVLQLIEHKELLDRRTKIIAGGQGCVNIQTFHDYIDVVNWGRCDGLLDKIIKGHRDDSCIDIEKFDINKKYKMRQAEYLYPNEITIGCKLKCKFCQYSHTRKLFGKNYNPGNDIRVPEDNFLSLKVPRPGYYITALDGLSEKSRFLVNKKISDEQIVEKLQRIIKQNFEKAVILKTFEIIGYPWETKESVREDLDNLRKLFKKADCKGGYINMRLSFNTFSPNPITPMAKMGVELRHSWWQDVLKDYKLLYKSDNLRVGILPFVPGPQSTLQRIMINRGAPADLVIKVGEEKRKGRPWEEFMSEIYSKYDVHKYTQKQENDVNIDTFFKFKYFKMPKQQPRVRRKRSKVKFIPKELMN